MRNIKIQCTRENCPNYEVVHYDEVMPIPNRWLCSTCQDHDEEQMLEDLARREQDRNRPIIGYTSPETGHTSQENS